MGGSIPLSLLEEKLKKTHTFPLKELLDKTGIGSNNLPMIENMDWSFIGINHMIEEPNKLTLMIYYKGKHHCFCYNGTLEEFGKKFSGHVEDHKGIVENQITIRYIFDGLPITKKITPIIDNTEEERENNKEKVSLIIA